jgi:hypothetical protein
MAEPLIPSTYCTQSSAAKVAFFVANGIMQHEEIDGSPCDFGGREGGENLAIHNKSDTLDQVVDGWMASPHHKEVIMTKAFKYAGYASAIYPANIERIAMGPGIYNPDTGEYSEEITYYDIPEADRGSLKVYCLRMTVTE